MATGVAFVGIDRQIHVMRGDGSDVRPVTFAKIPTALSRWGGTKGKDACTWPVWSPDGRWICCFQEPLGEDHAGPALVVAVEAYGVEEQALVALDGEIPIYAQWNAAGNRLAVLTQDQDQLSLWTCTLGALGARRSIEQGAPLFYSWAPKGDRIVVQVGRRATRTSHVVVRDPVGSLEDEVLAEVPRASCTPLFVGDANVFVEAAPAGHSTICASEHGERRVLVTLEGLVAMVPRPGHAEVAVGATPIGDDTPYHGVSLVGLDGSVRPILDEQCFAFFFDPKGERLVYAKARGLRQGITLHVREPSGETRLLGRFWPTEEQVFYLQFFEQFAASHPIVSSDGRMLYFCGYESPTLQGEGVGPRIFAVDLDDDAALPRIVGEGSFAVCSR